MAGAECLPWQWKNCQKLGRGKNQEKREKSGKGGKIGKKRQNREGSFTLHLLIERAGYSTVFNCMIMSLIRQIGPAAFTVVWNDYLLIFWPNVIFYYTRSWKPNANNQICWITKVSTHSKTLIQFCWKFIYFKDVYWWFLKIWICDKMRALFIFQIIDYAWISIMLFDLCWKWQIKFCWWQVFHLHNCFR